jgi:abortive infection bacteriophage resistance protein
MALIEYNKPALTFEQQFDQLVERGLKIENREKALHLLQHISYYRFSAYWYPLLEDKTTRRFKDGATFEMAFQFYCFDKKLRKLISNELEKLEVSFRTQIIYVLSHAFGPFWFENESLFPDKEMYAKVISKLRQEYKRSDEQFIKEFKKTYSNRYPPSWIILEICSFGTLSQLYAFLKPCKEKQAIAKYYGLHEVDFMSWLHALTYTRNICAHHARLWNRVMRIKSKYLRNPKYAWLNSDVPNDRMYYVLSMMQYLLRTVNPNNKLLSQLDKLFTAYPVVQRKDLGFAKNWKEDPLWKIG